MGRLYSDLDSGDDEESQNSRSNDTVMHAADEVDESKFFAGVFTSQRTEEELNEYVAGLSLGKTLNSCFVSRLCNFFNFCDD